MLGSLASFILKRNRLRTLYKNRSAEECCKEARAVIGHTRTRRYLQQQLRPPLQHTRPGRYTIRHDGKWQSKMIHTTHSPSQTSGARRYSPSHLTTKAMASSPCPSLIVRSQLFAILNTNLCSHIAKAPESLLAALMPFRRVEAAESRCIYVWPRRNERTPGRLHSLHGTL